MVSEFDAQLQKGVVQARTQVGRTNLQASSGIPGAPCIVLTGGTFFGDINVGRRRRWEKSGRRGRLTA
jgi:hypothetical protein